MGMLPLVVAVCLLAGCGEHDGFGGPAVTSGISGRVHLGPQCPVERKAHPCPDKPAAGSKVIVAVRVPGPLPAAGDVVARTTTHADGSYRVAVAPGTYLVTADAGMSCGTIAARVTTGDYSTVDIPCDTGIR